MLAGRLGAEYNPNLRLWACPVHERRLKALEISYNSLVAILYSLEILGQLVELHLNILLNLLLNLLFKVVEERAEHLLDDSTKVGHRILEGGSLGRCS